MTLSLAWRLSAREAYFAGHDLISTDRRPPLLGFNPLGLFPTIDRDVVTVVEGDAIPTHLTTGAGKHYRQTPSVHPHVGLERIEELSGDLADQSQARGSSASATALRWSAVAAMTIFAAAFAAQLMIGAGPGAVTEISEAVSGLGGTTIE